MHVWQPLGLSLPSHQGTTAPCSAGLLFAGEGLVLDDEAFHLRAPRVFGLVGLCWNPQGAPCLQLGFLGLTACPGDPEFPRAEDIDE
jgi:hypothetical protein